MASPGELIDTIAKVTGTPKPRVFSAHRYLREAGFISQGGRGTSAAKMTLRDATLLLIAAASVREIKESAELVERPGGLVSHGRWQTNFTCIPELAALPDDHSFADAIEALLGSAISGSLQAAAEKLEGGPVDLLHDHSPALGIEVTVMGPTPRGAITIEERVTDSEGMVYRYKDHHDRHFYGSKPTTPGSGNLAWLDLSRPQEMDADMQSAMTFTYRTLIVVGELISGQLLAKK